MHISSRKHHTLRSTNDCNLNLVVNTIQVNSACDAQPVGMKCKVISCDSRMCMIEIIWNLERNSTNAMSQFVSGYA